MSYIQGHPSWGRGFAGAIIRAVACRQPQDEVWSIQDRGKPVGRGWRQGDATSLVLQNLQGLTPNGNGANAPLHQARRLIQRAAHVLEAQGASYRDVVRTWFYLANILSWYPEFNRARSAVYQELGLMPINGGSSRRLPASPGISGEVFPGAAGVLDLLAVVGPPESRPLLRQLSSPALAQQITGVPGSPSATTTIQGDQIAAPSAHLPRRRRPRSRSALAERAGWGEGSFLNEKEDAHEGNSRFINSLGDVHCGHPGGRADLGPARG